MREGPGVGVLDMRAIMAGCIGIVDIGGALGTLMFATIVVIAGFIAGFIMGFIAGGIPGYPGGICPWKGDIAHIRCCGYFAATCGLDGPGTIPDCMGGADAVPFCL